jgi:hypothetical protein
MREERRAMVCAGVYICFPLFLYDKLLNFLSIYTIKCNKKGKGVFDFNI